LNLPGLSPLYARKLIEIRDLSRWVDGVIDCLMIESLPVKRAFVTVQGVLLLFAEFENAEQKGRTGADICARPPGLRC
jgi:hypothetical protein